MIMRKLLIITLAALIISLILISSSLAQDTLLISYQGRLTDDGGNPINGTPSIAFTIYDGSSVSKWIETHPTVQVEGGLFSVILGSQSAMPDSVFNGDDRYLGITVGGDSEISPRTLFTSAPGAAYAKRVAGDISTDDGMLVMKDVSGDSTIVFSSGHADNIARIRMISPGDDNTPIMEFNTSLGESKFKMACLDPANYGNDLFELNSTPGSGISWKMFNPQPEPPALYFELNANAETGPSMDFFDDAGKVMGVEPSPFNEGFSIRLIDPGEDKDRLKISADYMTDETRINFISPGNDGVTPSIELGTNPSNSFFKISRYDESSSILYEGFSFDLDNLNQTCNFRLISPGNDDANGFEIYASELTNSASFRLIDPGDDEHSLVEICGGPSTGASIYMFNPQPEPPALYFELNANTETGPNMDFFDDAGKVMGVEPTPFNEGFGLKLYDPTQVSETELIAMSGYYGDSIVARFQMFHPLATTPTASQIDLITTETTSLIKLGNISTDAGTSGMQLSATDNAATIVMGSGPGAPNSVMTFSTDNTEARIGIGTESPAENLVIGNNVGSYSGNRMVIGDTQSGVSTGLVLGEDDDSRGWFLWSVDDNYLDIGTKEAGTSYGNTMTIRSDQVGIKTTSPNYDLDVRGTIGNNTTLYHSDKRWKQDIRDLDGSLGRVMKLQGVKYNWKRDDYPEMNFPDGEQIGLIAQDVEKIIPEVVNESADGYKSLDYAKLVSVLIESIKEQQGQIDKQQDQIQELSKRVEELEGTKLSSR